MSEARMKSTWILDGTTRLQFQTCPILFQLKTGGGNACPTELLNMQTSYPVLFRTGRSLKWTKCYYNILCIFKKQDLTCFRLFSSSRYKWGQWNGDKLQNVFSISSGIFTLSDFMNISSKFSDVYPFSTYIHFYNQDHLQSNLWGSLLLFFQNSLKEVFCIFFLF